ncbi:hypothetical protein G4L39_01680 [Limisphaera ngatamarikiensis]|jgi:hypothetical protein|uniref:Uncharacterized protein n=1 Tax=Limisphaera ngatamarikiensis TaxID=1324935 RepID=A0A6M1RKI8_9BACT|nr:hypothetical protein [Limisphaera ngatamarikiensis]NGO38109.1 hypothetical protein [Limisphaera ngatamarikiensis]
MTGPQRVWLRAILLAAVAAGLLALFPRALAVMELAARELRYFWWVILLVGLAVWLIWGLGRR